MNIFASKTVLHSGCELNYPPYCIVTKDGKADGFSVELLRYVAGKIGMDITFKVGPWAEIKQEGIDGKLDVLPLVGYSIDRIDVFNFSAPYLVLYGGIFVRSNNTSIRSDADLKGKEVLVMEGDNAHEYVRREELTDRIITTKTYSEAFKLLSEGRGDAVVVQKLVGLIIIKDLALKNVKYSGNTELIKEEIYKPLGRQLKGFEQSFCFATAKGRKGEDLIQQLNKGLLIAFEDGTFDRLFDKWFPIEKHFDMATGIKYFLLILVIVIVLATIIGVFILKKQVRNKTAELSKSEKTFRKLALEWEVTFDSITDFIFILNTKHEFVKVNRSFCDIIKATPEDIIGKKCFEILHKSDKPWPDCPVAKTFQTKTTETEDVFDENIGIPLRVTSSPIFDDKGELKGVVHIAKDITERKKNEELYLQAQKIEAIGVLAGGIAHDFNNIMQGIYGNISLAKAKLPNDHLVLKYLEESELSMDRATLLTSQLLTFAKGGDPLREDVNLGNIVEEISRFDLVGSNIKLNFKQAKDLWTGNVDKGQIQQVFSDLIINAKQAMPDGGQLYISLKNEDLKKNLVSGLNKGKYIKSIVRDEGSGIDKKHINNVFEAFFTTKETGKGLGLATVYSIIKKHGGEITVNSELGSGTTFTIYLPVSELQQLPKTMLSQNIDSPTIQQTARILVMDDEAMICKLLNGTLEANGFSVSTTLNGKRAIEMYKQSLDDEEPFDAVIMDLTIPGGYGGKETIQDLLKINPKVRCIVSSGYANDPVMANYGEYGFKGIIVKPYTTKTLMEVLNQVLKE